MGLARARTSPIPTRGASGARAVVVVIGVLSERSVGPSPRGSLHVHARVVVLVGPGAGVHIHVDSSRRRRLVMRPVSVSHHGFLSKQSAQCSGDSTYTLVGFLHKLRENDNAHALVLAISMRLRLRLGRCCSFPLRRHQVHTQVEMELIQWNVWLLHPLCFSWRTPQRNGIQHCQSLPICCVCGRLSQVSHAKVA